MPKMPYREAMYRVSDITKSLLVILSYQDSPNVFLHGNRAHVDLLLRYT